NTPTDPWFQSHLSPLRSDSTRVVVVCVVCAGVVVVVVDGVVVVVVVCWVVVSCANAIAEHSNSAAIIAPIRFIRSSPSSTCAGAYLPAELDDLAHLGRTSQCFSGCTCTKDAYGNGCPVTTRGGLRCSRQRASKVLIFS